VKSHAAALFSKGGKAWVWWGLALAEGLIPLQKQGLGENFPYQVARFSPSYFCDRLPSYFIYRLLSLNLNCLILGLVTGNVSTEPWPCNYCD